MNTLFCFVGDSGSGKTTLIKELYKQYPDDFKIMKSVTTRPRRDDSDELFYDLLSKDRFLFAKERCDLIEEIEYAGNLYALNRVTFRKTLDESHAMLAITEEGTRKIKDYHDNIFIISVLPVYKDQCKTHVRVIEKERSEADKNRSLTKSGLSPNYIIINSFLDGGLRETVDELAGVMFRETKKKKIYVR